MTRKHFAFCAKSYKGVIEKLKAFFEKYFGLGITEMQSEKEEN